MLLLENNHPPPPLLAVLPRANIITTFEGVTNPLTKYPSDEMLLELATENVSRQTSKKEIHLQGCECHKKGPIIWIFLANTIRQHELELTYQNVKWKTGPIQNQLPKAQM